MPYTVKPSAEVANAAEITCEGNVARAVGSDWPRAANVASTCMAPEMGSNTTMLVVVTISALPSAVKATPSGGSPVANVWRVLLFRLMSVTAFLLGSGASEIAVVGNQEELRIEGDCQRSRLGRHVHGAVNRVVRGRHDFDAVGREVGDIEQAARFIEGDVGSRAADRDNGPEGGASDGMAALVRAAASGIEIRQLFQRI